MIFNKPLLSKTRLIHDRNNPLSLFPDILNTTTGSSNQTKPDTVNTSSTLSQHFKSKPYISYTNLINMP